MPPRILAALEWARETDADARAILHGSPPLDITHGVLQASQRRTHWIVSIGHSFMAIQRINTSAGDIQCRNLRLPEHLKGPVHEA